MALAHITGGQYVPMTDATRLAQMIVAGVREEISLDCLMQSSRNDIAREMRKATANGADERATAVQLQQVLSKKKISVNRMKNEGGIPSREAEECYAKCIDMSDMQKQYKQTEVVTSKKTAEMDYSLEEQTTLSLEQAKRIVQKAKNWDYSSFEQTEKDTCIPCKYQANCHDFSTNHRNKYSHLQSSDLSTRNKHETNRNYHTTQRRETNLHGHDDSHRTACRYAEECNDHSDSHRAKYSHPESNDHRIECKYGAKCYDHSSYHRSKYSHVENNNHRISCKYGLQCYDHSEYHCAKYSHPNHGR